SPRSNPGSATPGSPDERRQKRQLEGVVQEVLVLLDRDGDGAERLEVRRDPLHVEQTIGAAVAVVPHPFDQLDERDLRRIAAGGGRGEAIGSLADRRAG